MIPFLPGLRLVSVLCRTRHMRFISSDQRSRAWDADGAWADALRFLQGLGTNQPERHCKAVRARTIHHERHRGARSQQAGVARRVTWPTSVDGCARYQPAAISNELVVPIGDRIRPPHVAIAGRIEPYENIVRARRWAAASEDQRATFEGDESRQHTAWSH